MDSSDTSNSNAQNQLTQARETMDVLMEVSSLLNTGLDRETLSICVSLCEAGVNPEALAAVIKELRSEARAAAQQQQQQQQPSSQQQQQHQAGDRTSTMSWRA